VSDREPLSPYLGGPGARWAQVVLLLLHVALLVALGFLATAFLRVQARLPLETWHRWVFYGILGFAFLAFTLRGWKIGRDLLAAWRSHSGRSSESGSDTDS
jgi:type VI protein secretion system component VasK